MAEDTSALRNSPSQIRPILRDLRDEALLPLLPVLLGMGCVVLGASMQLEDPNRAVLPGLMLYGLPVAVWAVRKWNHTAAQWLLVAGCFAVVLVLAGVSGVKAGLTLLALPVGLAALSTGTAGGAVSALACTLLLLLAPTRLLPDDSSVRVVAGVGAWGTLGLIYLAIRPLNTALEWSWSSHEQGRSLLERARDYQVQLKQTLADLADANLQLTRLNRLAQGLRETAEEARRTKEQFVANVSHELRTPLNMIIGFSEMILHAPQTYGPNLPAALLADLAVIRRNSQHLSSLIDDVLDLSQIEARQIALTKEPVSLREVVEAAVTAVQPLFDSKRLYLKVKVADDLPPIICDRTRIREVLLNLLSNAGRFTEEGGVHLCAWREEGAVVVSVADSGPGIAAEDVARIFRPFQQLDASLRRRHGGSGLGLSISKSFVELHGGKMWLESEQGRGTTFYFRLPTDAPDVVDDGVARWFSPYWHYEERTHRSLAPAPVVRPRLVVMDGGGALQRLVMRYMNGAEVVPVTSLEEGAAEIARAPAQAFLVNDMSVGETLKRLSTSSALAQGTPAIICSVPGAGEMAGNLGVSGYLVKPIARDTLLGALEDLHLPGNTILIVDDEPEALRLFRRMLATSGRGYRVLTASDGVQAMNMLREERPHAVLLDLVMPQMDGFQFLASKREDTALATIPVVIISAQDPAGQPIVSNALAVTRGGGLSAHQLLACIRGLTGTLAAAGQAGDPKPLATPPC